MQAQAPNGAIIDALIITHPHDDHYPGAEAILSHYQVREFYDPGYRLRAPGTGASDNASRKRRPMTSDCPAHRPWSQFGHPDWGSELQASFCTRTRGHRLVWLSNTLVNNASMCLRIVYGSQSFLFMGDAEGKIGTVIRHPQVRGATAPHEPSVRRACDRTVLKVAHHGSETSSTVPFIQAVDPRVVIVSSGRRKYGTRFLADASTLQRYCDHSPAIRIYRTDENDAPSTARD